jgi:hypothetical protein
MIKRFVITAAACLEIVVGATFLAVPDFLCRLLFAAAPEGVAIPLARLAGLALLGLGIAGLPSKLAGSTRGTVLGLLAFNVGATVFFAWVAVATTFSGLMLWPVVILHAVIAVALLAQFLAPDFGKS